MNRPIKTLGLMPAMPLPDDMLKSIGTYIYEEEFAPPCTHWANDLAKINSDPTAKKGSGQGKGKGKGMGNGQRGMGKGNGGNHDAMIQMKYSQLCN